VLVLLSPSVGLSKVLVVTIADSGADTQIAFVKMGNIMSARYASLLRITWEATCIVIVEKSCTLANMHF